MPTYTRLAPVILALTLVLAAGCGGGGSSSVIGTGLPAGTSSDSFFTGSLVLSVKDAPSATFFDVPLQVADATLPVPASGLSLVSGAGYKLFQPKAPFSSPVTMAIKYDPSKLPLDPSTKKPLEANLAIYFLGAGNVWTYAAPVAGGAVIDTTKHTVSTTISAVGGTGVYAVLAIMPPVLPAVHSSTAS